MIKGSLFDTADWCKGRASFHITFERTDFVWMRDVLNEYMSQVLVLEDHEIIAHTLRFLKPLRQKIMDIASRYSLQEKEAWHVRAKHVSLKSGIYGIGPYVTMEQVIKSIITGQPGHQCIPANDEELTIYFFPWRGIMHEFRVFVFDGVVKAISSRDTDILDTEAICKCALEFTPQYATYAADVALMEDGRTYYAIEPNYINENTGLGLFTPEELEEAKNQSSGVKIKTK